MIKIGGLNYSFNIDNIESIKILIKRDNSMKPYFEIIENGIKTEYEFHWSNMANYKSALKDISKIQKYVEKNTIRKNKLKSL